MELSSAIRYRIFFLVGASLLAFCGATIAANPRAMGYELSLYTAYPLSFWIALVLTLILGGALLLQDAFGGGTEGSWKGGYVLLLAANAMLLFLPSIRYTYAMGRADILTFVGWIEYIHDFGELDPENYYSVLHVYSSMLADFTGIEPLVLSKAIAPLFSLAYLLAIYCLVARFTASRQTSLMALPLASLLFLQFEHFNFTAYNVSYFLVPIALLLYVRTAETGSLDTRLTVTLLLLVLPLSLFHPLTAVMIGTLFVVFGVTRRLPRDFATARLATKRIRVTAVFAVGVATVAWFFAFQTIVNSAVSIIVERGGSEYEEVTSVAERVSPSIADLLLRGVTTYGLEASVIAVSGVLAVYLWYTGRTADPVPDEYALPLVAIATFATALSVVAFFADVLFGVLRFSRYLLLVGPILVGIGFGRLAQHTSASRPWYVPSTRTVTCMFLLVLILLSTFVLYPSPYTDDANLQISEREMEGMEWMYENAPAETRTEELGIQHDRYIDFYSRGTAETFTLAEADLEPPDHFGLNNNSTVGAAYNEDTHLVITELGRIRNQGLYPNYEDEWRHTPEDFEQIERDPTVTRVYSSDEFQAYYITASNESETESIRQQSRLRSSS